MTVRSRRRKHVEQTVDREWLERRDEEMARSVGDGLGLRPKSWWLHESGRPDLAEGAKIERYLPLGIDDDHPWFRVARDRFRYLVESGELTDDERDRILTGRDHEHCSSEVLEWRRRIIAEMDGEV